MAYSTKEAHFFFYVYPSWAEVRPICIFAARLVQENEKVIATMLISPNLLDKAQDEVFAELRGDTDESVLRRISDRLNPPPSDLVPYLTDTYGAVYKDLFQGNPISCVQTGTTFDAEIPPSVVVLDIFGYTQIDATRSISGTSVPIISWLSGYVASLLHLFGPGQTGGDLVYERTTGWVVKVPGIPDMYDWEYFPQNYGRDPIPSFVQVVRAGIWGADGAFVTSTPLFEKESLEAMKSWFSAMGQEVHVIGPLLPSGYDNDLEDIPGHTDIQLFLDKTLTARGQKSVILMSFGPLLWPRYSDHIEEVIEALIEKGFPFISCASLMARISEELRERVKLSGIGIISQWVRVPHQYILNHPATGWFITHAGHNSVMESLGSGIPMICWPFVTDQAAAAAHLTENLKVAFELIEVRTGLNGLKPLLRNGRKPKGSREAAGVEIREVIDACRGERGAELAWNALKLEARLAEAWGPAGASRKVLRAFLNKYSRSM